jgi:hypothetical protein
LIPVKAGRQRVHTALAHPDSLVHLFEHTFAEVLAGLAKQGVGPVEPRPEAACACNPLRVHFPAFERKMLEALVLAQAVCPGLTKTDRVAGLDQLRSVIRRIARRELEIYDALGRQTRQRNGEAG